MRDGVGGEDPHAWPSLLHIEFPTFPYRRRLHLVLFAFLSSTLGFPSASLTTQSLIITYRDHVHRIHLLSVLATPANLSANHLASIGTPHRRRNPERFFADQSTMAFWHGLALQGLDAAGAAQGADGAVPGSGVPWPGFAAVGEEGVCELLFEGDGTSMFS